MGRWLRSEWDGKEEGGADTRTTFYPHPSPVPFHDLGRNKEAQSQTGERLGRRVTYPKEAFKEVFMFLWSNTNTKILHTDGRALRPWCEPYHNLIGLRRIFQRIGKQIREHLTDTFIVSGDDERQRFLDT